MKTPLLVAAAAITIGLAGCESSAGNLYFLSVQRFGVEASASDPTTNGMPKVNIGYESFKGTINPVKNKDGTLRNRAYSVLGITDAGAASGDTNMTASEWFATGVAADLLADNPATPAALAGTASLTPEVLERATQRQLAQTYESIDSAYTYLSGLPDADQSREDKAVLAGMDALHTLVDGFTFQQFAADGSRSPYSVPGGNDWSRVTTVRMDLSNSITHAYNRSTNGPDAAAKQAAADARVALINRRAELDRKILGATAAQAMWKHVVGIIRNGKAR
ncbi:MAG: hypothetical protein KAI24_04600 [Planctomycetes bacterium]|nr:hypothetical protein [Planctomycetota bacterium]